MKKQFDEITDLVMNDVEVKLTSQNSVIREFVKNKISQDSQIENLKTRLDHAEEMNEKAIEDKKAAEKLAQQAEEKANEILKNRPIETEKEETEKVAEKITIDLKPTEKLSYRTKIQTLKSKNEQLSNQISDFNKIREQEDEKVAFLDQNSIKLGDLSLGQLDKDSKKKIREAMLKGINSNKPEIDLPDSLGGFEMPDSMMLSRERAVLQRNKITTQDQSTNTDNHPIPTQKSSLKTTHIEQHTQRERSESAQEDMKTHDLGSISDSYTSRSEYLTKFMEEHLSRRV